MHETAYAIFGELRMIVALKQDHEQEYWDQVAATFNDNGQQGLWRQHSDNVNQQLIHRFLRDFSPSHILKTDLFDEAVSNGLYPFLATLAPKVSGIDLSAQAVQAAQARYPELDCHEGDLRNLPFEKNSFDCVISNSSLDHFPNRSDLDQSINELFRVLQPGGKLLISLDNIQNPLIWIRSNLPQGLLRKTGLVPYYVGKSLNRRGLTSALEQTGFIVRETRGIMHCPRVLAVRWAAQVQNDSKQAQQLFLEKLQSWEKWADRSSTYFSAHFVAAHASKPE